MTLLSPEPEPTSAPRRRLWLALGAAVALAAVFVGVRSVKRAPDARPTKPGARRASPPPPPSSPPPAAASSREPAPARVVAPPAPLRVEADVPDASVFVDRRFVGKAPVDVRDVKPGPHRLNVSAEGHEMYAEDFELGADPRTIDVRFNEVRLDESMAVVHKHGLGSCRGLLRADPGGLRFEAEGGKDSFHGPLADLERFEVDYLKKTMRVSLRGGRSYTFTVDGPSADPLLAFQHKVDKARKRLRPL